MNRDIFKDKNICNDKEKKVVNIVKQDTASVLEEESEDNSLDDYGAEIIKNYN